MPDSTNTSFIPKRNPTNNNVRTGPKRQVFVGTFIIRVLFVATLLASAGVFVYERKLNSDLNKEIVRLDTAISDFKEAEFFSVLEVDTRIIQAKDRLTYSASIVAILDALEKSTISTAEITDLTLQRVDDKSYEIALEMKTNSFDSVIFQKEILEKSDKLVVSEIDDVALQTVPPNNDLFEKRNASLGESPRESVSFKAVLIVDTAKISHKVEAGSGEVLNSTVNVPDQILIGESGTVTDSNSTGI